MSYNDFLKYKEENYYCKVPKLWKPWGVQTATKMLWHAVFQPFMMVYTNLIKIILLLERRRLLWQQIQHR